MRRLLKLQHHKHTGKLIHHRHTSYRALFAITLIVGGLIMMTGRIAQAADLSVLATVPAPIPSGAPSFTAPTPGTVTDNPIVNFEGTCPVITPSIIIVIYDGPSAIGSSICNLDGTFQVTATIAEGTRSIVATVVTITGDNGESSQPLLITYRPSIVTNPGTPTSPPSSQSPSASTPSTPGRTTLAIVPDKPFLTFGVKRPVNWSGRFEGGTPPYKVVIDWGDGKTTVEMNVGSDPRTFAHTYHNNRIYTISISVTDSGGLSLRRYFAAVSMGGPAESRDANGFITALDSFPNNPTATILWLYIAILITLLIMWRYEHLHHGNKKVGVPLHYTWQKSHRAHRLKHR